MKQWEQPGTPVPVATAQDKGHARPCGAVGAPCKGIQRGMNPCGCFSAVLWRED